jgi:DNA helicase HerA-like ATPase
MEGFYLGGVVDPATGDRTDELVDYDPGDLTTHGVIVGMTGSGKTGLGIIYLEEALLRGIPTLILDPKGDMTNLLLTFPQLRPSDFEPWIDEAQARKEDKTVPELAADTAELWAEGLGRWDQDGSRIAALVDAAEFTIYTPGSTAGLPLNIVGSLADPGLAWDTEAEALRDEIQGFVSGLLGLIGMEADPISSREHILLSNIIEHAWRHDTDLDLAGLLGQIQRPPMRKLGVFDVDTFFPEKDRMALAMKLNGLVASPAFASWMEGPDLDIGSLLWNPDGKARASIVYLAHLSESERQFIVTLLLSRVVTWMRRQSGTGDLRAMVYMDEVFGFVPPTAEPPAKRPILTLLKQARAFGVGLLLSTQNPVDLDYKAMSNAGTWCVGRLQTERDKARIVEALKSARGDVDVKALDASISGLDKRQFLLHDTHEPAPRIFTTRWALSYLRGPLTKEQITRLSEPRRSAAAPAPLEAINEVPIPNAGAEAAADIAAATPTPLAENETPLMPEVAAGTAVRWLDPAARWIEAVGGDPTSTRFQAAVAARVHVTFDERRADLVHQDVWEAVFTPLTERLDPHHRYDVDHDPRDFVGEPPAKATYLIPDARIGGAAFYRSAVADIRTLLHREHRIKLFHNRELDLVSRVGEDEATFRRRCDEAGQDRADAVSASLRDKYEERMARLRTNYETAQRKAQEAEADLQGAREDQLMDAAGAVLDILRGRRRTRSITGSARSRSSRRSKQQRLESAQTKVQDVWQQMADLEADLLDELEGINDEWELAAERIDELEVGLEKDDIDVDELTLVWIPV